MKSLIQHTCNLANKATQCRNSDRAQFEQIIKDINAIDDPTITKADLVNGLVGEAGYTENEWWIEEFILHDIKHSDIPEETESLLVFLLMAGGDKAEELFKRAVVEKLTYFDSFTFYEFAHVLVHDENLPEKLIPDVLKVKDYKQKLFSEEKPEMIVEELFQFDDELNEFTINPEHHEVAEQEDELVTIGEMYDDYEMDYLIELYHGDYWQEEKVYESCYDQDNDPNIDRLKKAVDISSKARHKLLRLENRPIEAWFHQDTF